MSAFAPKWRSALYELEQQYAQGPDIDFVIVGFLLYHFGCHVLVGSTQGASVLEYGRKSEVAQFSMIVLSQQYVFRLF